MGGQGTRNSDSFRDVDRSAKATTIGLFIVLAIMLVSIVSSGFQYQLLSDFEVGVYSNESQINMLADSNDRRQEIVGYAYIAAYFIVGFIFLSWVYKIAFNARLFNIKEMNIQPGWVVAWFFIPVAFLWMPYLSLSRAWRATTGERPEPILLLWWLMFLVFNFMARSSQSMGERADTIPALKSFTLFSMFIDAIGAVGVILAILTVRHFTLKQNERINSERALSLSISELSRDASLSAASRGDRFPA